MSAYGMFAASKDGGLMLCHMANRAWEVRVSVARLYLDRDTPLGWSLARADGWRVTPVIVQDRKSWLKRGRA